MKKINTIILVLLTFFCSRINAQQLDKLYLSVQNTGSVYDITSLNSTLPAAALTQPANPERIANLAIGYDFNNLSQLVFLHSGTAATEAIYKTSAGVTTSVTNLNAQGIGGYGTNNAPGAYFGRAYGFVPASKTVWEVYPTYQSIGAITGDQNWNYGIAPATGQTDTSIYSSIYASDAAFDVYNNIYTIVERQTNGPTNTATYARFLYRVNLATRIATQIVQISGPVGTAVPNTVRKPIATQAEVDAYINVSSATSVGNVRGLSYLNGLFYVASANGATQTRIFTINPKTGVSALVASYTVGTAASNIDLAGDQYFSPFIFDCGVAGGGLQGATPYFVRGTTATQTIRVNIKNVYYNESPVNVVVSGSDITTQTHSVNLVPNQTFIDLPITYTGGGAAGSRTVTITLQGTAQQCTYNVAVYEDSDNDGIPNNLDLDDDNDGIPDVDENCNPYLAQNSAGVWKGKTVSNLTVNLPSASAQTTVAEFNDGQNKYHINQSGGTTRVAGSGNISYTYTFSTPVPANEVAFYIEDLDPQFGTVFPTYQFSINGGAVDANFTSVNYTGGSGPYMTFNSLTGAISVADRTIADYRLLLKGRGNQLVSSITITSTGITAGDAVAYSLFALNACDTDNDSIPNYLDLDSDNDGCLDAMEGNENVATSMLVTAASGLSVGVGSSAANQNLCATTTCVNTNGVPNQVNAGGLADTAGTQGQGIGESQNSLIAACYCYKPVVTTPAGSILTTPQGITSLGRAGSADTNWPTVRKGAWTVLESKTKGFVMNRLTTAQRDLIPAANLVEGMMIYNITLDCVQVNTTGTPAGWTCFNTQTCPTN